MLNTFHDVQVPVTTFPMEEHTVECDSSKLRENCNGEDLQLCLVNSDPSECNQNLSKYLKNISETQASYHQLSVHAMKLITLNLFVKNYKMCVGKLLALMTLFTKLNNSEKLNATSASSDSDRMKEFVCVILFLVLKFKNSDEEEELNEFNRVIETDELFELLKNYTFITVVANFITSHIENTTTSFVLLKLCSDMIFEYLFHVELLSDQEFENLVSNTSLISTLIEDLLTNKSFHNYDINDTEWEDEDKLIAYEEFKLLLLINEQYLMKSYSCKEVRNKVFDGLMELDQQSDSVNYKISGFMNLLVYHINREESQIIKILILKFLYLIFTSSYTSKLYYLNDLKIILDIFIRELDDIEYVDEKYAKNRVLVITFLKVMYPMMMFSQLSDLPDGYRKTDVANMLLNIILNISSDGSESKQLKMIKDLATRCLSVPWLKKKKKVFNNPDANSSASSLNSSASVNSAIKRPSSSDSIANSFTRIASVRTFTRNDYHLHTTKHNKISEPDMATENNHNVFLKGFDNLQVDPSKRRQSVLDLPVEYLSGFDDKSKSSNLIQKAMRKKAPPPPPQTPPPPRLAPHPYERATRSMSPNLYNAGHVSQFSASPTPSRNAPPPPPPRRRR